MKNNVYPCKLHGNFLYKKRSVGRCKLNGWVSMMCILTSMKNTSFFFATSSTRFASFKFKVMGFSHRTFLPAFISCIHCSACTWFTVDTYTISAIDSTYRPFSFLATNRSKAVLLVVFLFLSESILLTVLVFPVLCRT